MHGLLTWQCNMVDTDDTSSPIFGSVIVPVANTELVEFDFCIWCACKGGRRFIMAVTRETRGTPNGAGLWAMSSTSIGGVTTLLLCIV